MIATGKSLAYFSSPLVPDPEWRGHVPLSAYLAEYAEWGQGSTIVLVPGLAGGFELLGPIIQRLAQTHRVVSYNLRGENDCFALRRPFDLNDLADDLVEFIDWHRLERPTVFGVSFGGLVALEAAARHRGRFGRLILQGVGAKYERNILQQIAAVVLSEYPLPTDNAFVNQFFNLLFGGRPRDRRLFHFVVRQCWRTDQSVMAHRFRLVEGFSSLRYLQHVKQPTMAIAGEKDLLVSQENLQRLCAGIADCRRVFLPKAGHLASLTHGDRIAAAIRRFLSTGTACHV